MRVIERNLLYQNSHCGMKHKLEQWRQLAPYRVAVPLAHVIGEEVEEKSSE